MKKIYYSWEDMRAKPGLRWELSTQETSFPSRLVAYESTFHAHSDLPPGFNMRNSGIGVPLS